MFSNGWSQSRRCHLLSLAKHSVPNGINGRRVMPIEANWSRWRCSTVCLKARGHQSAFSPAARRCALVCAWIMPSSDSRRPLPADSSPAVLVCKMSLWAHQSRSLTPVNSRARSLWSLSTGNWSVLSRMYTSCTARTTSRECLPSMGTAKVRLRTSTSWSSATVSFQNWSLTSHQRISAAVSSSCRCGRICHGSSSSFDGPFESLGGFELSPSLDFWSAEACPSPDFCCWPPSGSGAWSPAGSACWAPSSPVRSMGAASRASFSSNSRSSCSRRSSLSRGLPWGGWRRRFSSLAAFWRPSGRGKLSCTGTVRAATIK